MCDGEQRMGIVERCENALARIEKQGNEIMKKLLEAKNGDNLRTTGDGQNTEFINDRGRGAFPADSSGTDSLSLIYEEGRIRGLRSSDAVLPPKQIAIHIFSDSPLAVFQTDGDLQLRSVRRKKDT